MVAVPASKFGELLLTVWTDPMLLFQERFFRLQRDLIEDDQIMYFEPEETPKNGAVDMAAVVGK